MRPSNPPRNQRATRQQISSDVKDFVTSHITSVFQLEVLLLLHRTDGRCWTANEVSYELGIETDTAHTQLVALVEMGLLARSDRSPFRFFYDPSEDRLRAIIDSLALACARQRVAVYSLMLKKPDNRMQRFAEAFRLIKDKD